MKLNCIYIYQNNYYFDDLAVAIAYIKEQGRVAYRIMNPTCLKKVEFVEGKGYNTNIDLSEYINYHPLTCIEKDEIKARYKHDASICDFSNHDIGMREYSWK